MPAPEEGSESAVPGIGCALLVMGLIGAAFGIAALVGISDRIELEFFEIELNDTLGRVFWTAGCLILAGVGWLMLRTVRRAT